MYKVNTKKWKSNLHDLTVLNHNIKYTESLQATPATRQINLIQSLPILTNFGQNVIHLKVNFIKVI